MSSPVGLARKGSEQQTRHSVAPAEFDGAQPVTFRRTRADAHLVGEQDSSKDSRSSRSLSKLFHLGVVPADFLASSLLTSRIRNMNEHPEAVEQGLVCASLSPTTWQAPC